MGLAFKFLIDPELIGLKEVSHYGKRSRYGSSVKPSYRLSLWLGFNAAGCDKYGASYSDIQDAFNFDLTFLPAFASTT